MKTHYVGMVGIGGCLPSFCDVYENRKQAIESLADICELSKRQRMELKKFGITDLKKNQGNEYAEIVKCNCSEPGEHQDDMSTEQFREEHPEFYAKEEVEENCEICPHSNDPDCPYPTGCPQK